MWFRREVRGQSERSRARGEQGRPRSGLEVEPSK